MATNKNKKPKPQIKPDPKVCEDLYLMYLYDFKKPTKKN